MFASNKKIFCEMQEHPEKYPDHEIEAMMDDIDHTPDTKNAWKKFRRHQATMHTSRRWLRIAAMLAGIIFISGIAYAVIGLLTQRRSDGVSLAAESNFQISASEVQASSPVRFENVRLDSLLSVVSVHYDKTVSFRDEEAKSITFFLTWSPDSSLADFLNELNTFDGLRLTLQRDTIFIDTLREED